MALPPVQQPLPQPVPSDRGRRRRSVAIGLVLFGLVILFYVLTIVKMGPAVFNRPL